MNPSPFLALAIITVNGLCLLSSTIRALPICILGYPLASTSIPFKQALHGGDGLGN